jgi:hypothetical protein
VGTDVEGKISRLDKAGVERVHCGVPLGIAVVNIQGAPERDECRVVSEGSNAGRACQVRPQVMMAPTGDALFAAGVGLTIWDPFDKESQGDG